MALDVVEQVAAAETARVLSGGAHDQDRALDVADRRQRRQAAADVGERGGTGPLAGRGEAQQRPARRELRGIAGLRHPEAAVAVLGAADVVGGAGGLGGRGEREGSEKADEEQAKHGRRG